MVPEFVAIPCFWHLQTLDLVTTSICHTLQWWRQQQPITIPPTLCYRVFCKTRNTGILSTVTVLTCLHTHTWAMPEHRTRDTQDRGQRNRWLLHRLWVSPFHQCGRTVANVSVANTACPGRARVNFLSCEKTVRFTEHTILNQIATIPLRQEWSVCVCAPTHSPCAVCLYPKCSVQNETVHHFLILWILHG